MTHPYFLNDAEPWTELGDGIRRKIVGHTPELMSVLVQFDQGAIGTPHAHDAHDQIAFVITTPWSAIQPAPFFLCTLPRDMPRSR